MFLHLLFMFCGTLFETRTVFQFIFSYVGVFKSLISSEFIYINIVYYRFKLEWCFNLSFYIGVFKLLIFLSCSVKVPVYCHLKFHLYVFVKLNIYFLLETITVVFQITFSYRCFKIVNFSRFFFEKLTICLCELPWNIIVHYLIVSDNYNYGLIYDFWTLIRDFTLVYKVSASV